MWPLRALEGEAPTEAMAGAYLGHLGRTWSTWRVQPTGIGAGSAAAMLAAWARTRVCHR